MQVDVLVRGRYWTLEGVEVKQMGGNVWELTIPTTGDNCKRTRRGTSAEDWDGALFMLDGDETQPAVGSGEGAEFVKVTVYVV